ncbi:MAG: aminomethyl-transferring glycine dehydrogenase subunit GcvPA [Nitrospinae bacterium]|nr:aminomethyl-transferring glycine dehydrogenase subunit GcvPA [Nitrospinota bacterium]
MRYIPNTENDCREMLKEIGVDSHEELFSSIPEGLRLKKGLNLPHGMSEGGLSLYMKVLSERNGTLNNYISFLGGGAYNHFIPTVVNHLISRSEFSTPYTPYQPEISQGTLQWIYEFQSLISILMGMEVANASMYDGASALAEGVIMAIRINRRDKVIISRGVHPEHRRVVETYCNNLGIDIMEAPFTEKGITDLNWIRDNISEKTSAVVLQNPNFFGCLEDIETTEDIVHEKEGLLIISVVEPISLGILRPPGDFGADIVTGEGQSFGNLLSYGGPYVGFFTTRERFIRNMPGRLIGETVDCNGKRGYVLTLATREQHIRREKATSNICSNEALCALAVTIYLSIMGREGLKRVAYLNVQKANYARKRLSNLDGLKIRFNSPIFNEFVIETPESADKIHKKLMKKKVIAGLNLKPFYPEMRDSLLMCFTENNTKDEIDILCETLQEVIKT